jgi:hypothetical protein
VSTAPLTDHARHQASVIRLLRERGYGPGSFLPWDLAQLARGAGLRVEARLAEGPPERIRTREARPLADQAARDAFLDVLHRQPGLWQQAPHGLTRAELERLGLRVRATRNGTGSGMHLWACWPAAGG